MNRLTVHFTEIAAIGNAHGAESAAAAAFDARDELGGES